VPAVKVICLLQVVLDANESKNSLAELAPRTVTDDEEFVQHLMQRMINKEPRKIHLLVKHCDAGFKGQRLDTEKWIQALKRAMGSHLDLELRSRFAPKKVEWCENLC